MPEADLLQAFLDTQREEGRYFDSQAFTINSVKAMQKLGRFQLEDSGLWLVKLVQAAVASGAPEVRITFGKRLVNVEFAAPSQWQADEVLETVLSGTLPGDNALLHLVTGARACASSLNETVAWSCGAARVELADDACKIRQRDIDGMFRLAATRPARSRSLYATLATSVYELAKQTAEEYEALRARCWVCPIPVIVDGRPLERGYGMVEGGQVQHSPMGVLSKRSRSDGYHLTACVGLRYIDTPATQAALPVPPEHRRLGEADEVEVQRPLYRNGTFLVWKCWQHEARAAVALLVGQRVHGEKICVHDGAVVFRQPSNDLTFDSVLPNSKMAARILFSVSAAQLDLSGFALRDVSLDELTRPCYRALKEVASGITERTRWLSYVPATTKEAKVERVLFGTAFATVTLATAGFAAPVVGGGALFFLGINRMQWRRQMHYAARLVAAHLPDD